MTYLNYNLIYISFIYINESDANYYLNIFFLLDFNEKVIKKYLVIYLIFFSTKRNDTEKKDVI